jgi:hypothetical protein
MRLRHAKFRAEYFLRSRSFVSFVNDLDRSFEYAGRVGMFPIKFLAIGVEMGTLVDRIGRNPRYFIALALCLLASATNPLSFLHAQNVAKLAEVVFASG